MRAILIDPFKREITEVDYNGNFRQIYNYIHAECFTTVRVDETNHLFLDDEGLFQYPDNQSEQKCFFFASYPNPLAGYALCLGCDEEGSTVPSSFDIELMRILIIWLDGSI